MKNSPLRLHSIDVLRALIMLLMIFVNDLWSLKDIPNWLEHVSADADGMGLADIVFPAFLFIVGMSMPFAINNRKKKGDPDSAILLHIFTRSFALLVMGVFLVNGEYLNEEVCLINRPIWNVACCLSFILIWNVYPDHVPVKLQWALKLVGITVLVTLAYFYLGGDTGSPQRFNTWWWGILGLIGWAYLVAAVLVLYAKGRIGVMVMAFLVCLVLSSISHLGLVPEDSLLLKLIGPFANGAHPALTLAGVILSSLFWDLIFREQPQWMKFTYASVAIAVVLLVSGLVTRPLWGISKIRATPSWVLVCSAIVVVLFLVVAWLVDRMGKQYWFKPISAGGSDTLLCYLLPYFAYAMIPLFPFSLPDPFLTGILGLAKSFLFSLLIIQVAGWLSKQSVKLKL
ncbi:DUF5009 domain-containing protein [Flavihumibacter rivuli]|uniref:heparan-alpha-glucosaminide N-acetyltransferase domain-containing protein n=1 Tax=Flavihumibacter rivuli TaxID=2838156 RepID=UPI001BDE17A1|nr:DUF5009 domain-containing protein [Flavihumibacter rivuli]ULQ56629.1 DUF5009 domain-containing protein [Flavihumibacter rivuli]